VSQPNIAAHHEAGHAVIALALSVTHLHASIEARGNSVGRVTHHGLPPLDDDSAMLIALAGPLAQKRFAPESEWFTGDFAVVDQIIAKSAGRATQRDERLVSLCEHADQMIEYFWDDIAVTAKALLRHKSMSGDQITSAIRAARQESQRRCRPGDPPAFALGPPCRSCSPPNSD
jgi:hypothetical protein